jgi:hypothetical protein
MEIKMHNFGVPLEIAFDHQMQIFTTPDVSPILINFLTNPL